MFSKTITQVFVLGFLMDFQDNLALAENSKFFKGNYKQPYFII